MAQALLCISDARVKQDITISSMDADLQSVLSIPVHRFSFIDRVDQSNTIGFIAQEVEQAVPCAVNTTTHAIPDIMQMAVFIDCTRIGLSNSSSHSQPQVNIGDVIKIIHDGTEFVRKVVDISHEVLGDETRCILAFDEPFLPSQSQPFVYGHVVDDFKLINSDRLMPIVFNSVKSLHASLERQTTQLVDVMDRLRKLEMFMAAGRR